MTALLEVHDLSIAFPTARGEPALAVSHLDLTIAR